MTQLIVFDFDGTLVDTFPLFELGLKDYCQKNNLSLPCFETMKNNYARLDEIDLGWNVSLEIQMDHVTKIFRHADSMLYEACEKTIPPLFQGAHETLVKIHSQDLKTAIVSAKPMQPLVHHLAHFKMENDFDAMRTWEDFTERGMPLKPAPDHLLSVMDELNVKPDDTLMVGDTTMDIEMAKNAGVRSIGVTWGAHKPEILEHAGADTIIRNCFTELLDHI